MVIGIEPWLHLSFLSCHWTFPWEACFCPVTKMLLEKVMVGVIVVPVLTIGSHQDHSTNIQHEGSQNRDLWPNLHKNSLE